MASHGQWGSNAGDDDYKEAWVEQERSKQNDSTAGWIYIGIDTRHDDIVKIGLTAGLLGTRASGSQNPFYALLCAFKVKDGVDSNIIHSIEDAALNLMNRFYQRIHHVNSGRPSEWFYAPPLEVRDLVHDFVYERFNAYMHCYYCQERGMGVIYSWENTRLLDKGAASPYQAADLSNPPPQFECLMPPGCGAECDCW